MPPVQLTPLRSTDVVPYVETLLPMPGAGTTRRRWDAFARIARDDLPLAKLVEPHHDAAAILTDLDEDPPGPRQIWGVWAAEPPFAVLRAEPVASGWRLFGSKAFCSGASLVTHALVTAEHDGASRLFSVELGGGIDRDTSGPQWVGLGMARAATQTLCFDDVAARPIGGLGAYVARPGFWFGAIGVAACWFGGARGVADSLERAVDRLDAHGLAHLGAVRAELDSLDLAFEAAASRVDSCAYGMGDAERLAHVLRSRTAEVVEVVVSHVGRALGPGPLAVDGHHAQHLADLQVFVRQHHAERDLARLGSIGGTHG